tara:strand:- start:108 stop:1016 length:909 start_codon:yes stop_codon:yes gene_type:complete
MYLPPELLARLLVPQKAAVVSALKSGNWYAILTAVRDVRRSVHSMCAASIPVSKEWRDGFKEPCKEEAWKVACEVAGFLPVDKTGLPENIGDWRTFFETCYDALKNAPGIVRAAGGQYLDGGPSDPLTYRRGNGRQIRSDIRTLMIVYVLHDGSMLKYASKSLKNDKDVVLAAVRKTGSALAYASKRLENDKEVVLAAVTNDGRALFHASGDMQKDKEVVLAAVTNNAGALNFASDDMQDDKEVVLAAVTKNGLQLVDASERLRGMKDVVMAAVRHHGVALMHALGGLRDDKELMDAASTIS